MSPKQRFMRMILADVVCLAIALAAIVAHVSFRMGAALPVFVLAIVAGFAAQVWFIVGLARASRLEQGA
jgi:hypothetical protein